MTDASLSSTDRVAAAAQRLGLAIEIVKTSEPTRTAQEAATACNCDIGQIVKSLVFTGAQSGRPYLLLVSGANRVDEAGAAASIGEPLTRPNGNAVRRITGYAIGGIPPFGHEQQMATFIDEDLLDFKTVWAAAGTPFSLFEVDPRALAEVVGAKPMAMAEA